MTQGVGVSVGLAKYQKIRQWLEDGINKGIWRDQSPLPPETEIAAQFGTSRMTARRAIMELVAEDRLQRLAGVGTFVKTKKAASSLLKIKNIADEVKDRGNQYANQLLLLEDTAAPAKAAAGLEIKLNTPIYHSQILHFENQQPIQLESRYINKTLVPDYVEQAFNSEFTPASFLQKHYPLTKVLFYVEARIGNDFESDQLALGEDNAVLVILRKTWSKEGLISYTELVHPGHAYQLGGELNFSTQF
ncbi:UTRA domain-containing protein [Alteromonas sediminis]|uniref:UTRA domain-containing protein n=1 Tax=Alteromonas sediminis TaxID=2259342 RepID=A0A3N5YAP1_9ALTE|nr:UTRA domain-containing protein [Alteromonas sediminis]RPJ68669.1 UTRA domain-containing protein [Alteromonas sediminis]